MTGMSVWGVCSGKKCCHVVVVFPVCVRFDVHKKPKFQTPNSNVLNAIREQYDSWYARQKIQSAVTCFAMGSTFDLVDIIQGASCPTCFSQFSPEANDHWKTTSFNTGSVSLVTDFFPDRLKPVSVTERMEQIRRVIDEKLANLYQGNLRVADFVQWLGYTPKEVQEAFRRLEATGRYHVYTNQERDFVAIEKRSQ